MYRIGKKEGLEYSKDMCTRSLDIFNRTVMFGLHPDHKSNDVTKLVRTINKAAGVVL